MSFIDLQSGNLSFLKYYEIFDKVRKWVDEKFPDKITPLVGVYDFDFSNEAYFNIRNWSIQHFPMSDPVKLEKNTFTFKGEEDNLYTYLKKEKKDPFRVMIIARLDKKDVWVGIKKQSEFHKHIEACIQERRIPFLIGNDINCSCFYAMLAKHKSYYESECEYETSSYNNLNIGDLFGNENNQCLSQIEIENDLIFYKCYEFDQGWVAGCLTNIATFESGFPKIYLWAKNIEENDHQYGFNDKEHPNSIFYKIKADGGCFLCPMGVAKTINQKNQFVTLSSVAHFNLTVYPSANDFSYIIDLYNRTLNALDGLTDYSGLAIFYSKLFQRGLQVSNLIKGNQYTIKSEGTSTCACNNLGDPDSSTNPCPSSSNGSLKYANRVEVQGFTVKKFVATPEYKSNPEGSSDWVYDANCCPVIGAPLCSSGSSKETSDIEYPSFAGESNAGFGVRFYNDFDRDLIPQLPISIQGLLVKNRGNKITTHSDASGRTYSKCDSIKGRITLNVNFYVFPRSAFMYVAKYWLSKERNGCLNLLLRKIVSAFNFLDDNLNRYNIDLVNISAPVGGFILSPMNNWVAHDPTFYDTVRFYDSNSIELGYPDKAKIVGYKDEAAICNPTGYGFETTITRVKNSKISCKQ